MQSSGTAGIRPAVALLHSFEFGSAVAGFKTVLQDDPTCGIAYWSITLSQWSKVGDLDVAACDAHFPAAH